MENNQGEPQRRSSTGRRHSPTREAILHALDARPGPTSIAALARATGLHENTVRGHLTALWRDGYVERTSETPEGRGRPSWLWQAKDRHPDSPYAALAGVLAETVARLSPSPEEDAREAGRAWGRRIAAADAGRATGAAGSSPVAVRSRVIDVMRDQGFAPRLRGEGDGRDDGDPVIVLRQCPLIDAATGHSDVVCSVHLGMVLGVAEQLGARDTGSELVPFAAPGECVLRLAVAG